MNFFEDHDDDDDDRNEQNNNISPFYILLMHSGRKENNSHPAAVPATFLVLQSASACFVFRSMPSSLLVLLVSKFTWKECKSRVSLLPEHSVG